MDLLANLALGFSVASTPLNLAYGFIGVLLGTLIGVLPGLGPIATIALLLPTTFGMDPTTALIMLSGIYYGAQYGGSTTAILVNIPGEASSVVTCLDGHKMALQGRAGPALAAAAIGSFVAGCFGTLVIGLFGPSLSRMALKFGAPEYTSLMVLGLIGAAVLAHGSLLRAFGMILTGLMISMIGPDLHSGISRFTFGTDVLADGVNIAIIAMGLFGFTEMANNLTRSDQRHLVTTKVGGLMPTWADTVLSWKPVLRGTVLGTFLGMLPGAGATLASFSAYALEKKLSKDPKRFGQGAIEGVAAPEAANNAGAQASFIPALTLGLPGNSVVALLLGAMIIHGITPGPAVIREQPSLFWGLIASMWIGNLFLVILNLPLIGLWIRLLTVPYRWLFPAILLFVGIGTYSLSMQPWHVVLVAMFGLAGLLFSRLGMECAPLVLGAVLGDLLEEHLRRSLLLSRGDPMIFIERPISLAFLVTAAVLIVIVLLPHLRKKREEVFAEATD